MRDLKKWKLIDKKTGEVIKAKLGQMPSRKEIKEIGKNLPKNREKGRYVVDIDDAWGNEDGRRLHKGGLSRRKGN